MIKTALLATVLLATLATESQARPRIWKVLEEVAVASVMPPPVYYVEQPRYYRQEVPVYYSQPPRCYSQPQVVYDRYGNQYIQPRPMR